MVDHKTARVVVTYGTETFDFNPTPLGEQALIEIGTITQDKQTDLEYKPGTSDGTKEQIVLRHQYITEDAGEGTSTLGALVSVTPEVTVPDTTLYVRFSRLETSVLPPAVKVLAGTVNKLVWDFDGDQRKWYFKEVRQVSNSGPNGPWVTQYEFALKDDTWDKYLVFIDEDTGKIPDDLEDEGHRKCRVLTEADWTPLATLWGSGG